MSKHLQAILFNKHVWEKKDAIEWMIQNDLLVKDTLLAYDEFISTNNPLLGGESKAHYDIMKKYNIVSKEIWHSEYTDKSTQKDITQSVFRIISL